MVIHANTNYCTHLSCSSWDDSTFQGTSHQRQVNGVLDNLVRMHYPGEVTWSDGTSSLATWWADYALAPDAMYENTQGAVWSDFWVSFLVILFQSFIPDTPDFANAWFWNSRDNFAWKAKTCGTKWGLCLRRMLRSSWVNPYQMDGFTLRTSTCKRSRAANGLLLWWFRYVSDRGTICNGKICWSLFH
jgi:hypothetical protein